jgi:hypothetical protein
VTAADHAPLPRIEAAVRAVRNPLAWARAMPIFRANDA